MRASALRPPLLASCRAVVVGALAACAPPAPLVDPVLGSDEGGPIVPLEVWPVDAGAAPDDADEALDEGGGAADAGGGDDAPADPGTGDDGGVGAPAPLDEGAAQDGCPRPTGPAFACAACATAAPGDVVDLDGLAVLQAPDPGLSPAASSSRALLFSDSPESPTTNGVLAFADLDAGPARVFVYHANGAASGGRKISVVVENPGAQTAIVDIRRFVVEAPGTGYLGIGRRAVARFLAADQPALKSVPAGGAGLLLTSLDGLSAAPGELVHAVVDVDFGAPVRLWVVALDPSTDALSHFASLPVLPRDGHQRGTFAGADRALRLPEGCALHPDDGVRRVRVGADTASVPAPLGVDELTGSAEALSGHYGVLYRLRLPVAEGESGVAVLLNPRGGAYGGAARVAGEVVDLPGASTSLADPGAAILLGRFSAGGVVDVELMPAGGASLPVDLLLVPVP